MPAGQCVQVKPSPKVFSGHQFQPFQPKSKSRHVLNCTRRCLRCHFCKYCCGPAPARGVQSVVGQVEAAHEGQTCEDPAAERGKRAVAKIEGLAAPRAAPAPQQRSCGAAHEQAAAPLQHHLRPASVRIRHAAAERRSLGNVRLGVVQSGARGRRPLVAVIIV
eukprot:3103130-Rhodomonas_salina.2